MQKKNNQNQKSLKYLTCLLIGLLLIILFPPVFNEICKILNGEINFYEKYLWLSSMTSHSLINYIKVRDEEYFILPLLAGMIFYYLPLFIIGITVINTITDIIRKVIIAKTLLQLTKSFYEPICWICAWLTLDEINKYYKIESGLLTIFEDAETSILLLYYLFVPLIFFFLSNLRTIYKKFFRIPYDIIKKDLQEVESIKKENGNA